MHRVNKIEDSQFEAEVLGSSIPVLVDFYADWCGPCRRLAPVLEDLAEKYEGRIKFVKIDSDSDQLWAGRLGVRGLPTLVVFQDGQPVAAETGFVPPGPLSQALDKLLGAA